MLLLVVEVIDNLMLFYLIAFLQCKVLCLENSV